MLVEQQHVGTCKRRHDEGDGLPLAASVEQVVGTLSLEDALRDGQVRLAPGLVARAHGGVLYVDEVNLLPDALVDALLDVAASGVNTVERDGVRAASDPAGLEV